MNDLNYITRAFDIYDIKTKKSVYSFIENNIKKIDIAISFLYYKIDKMNEDETNLYKFYLHIIYILKIMNKYNYKKRRLCLAMLNCYINNMINQDDIFLQLADIFNFNDIKDIMDNNKYVTGTLYGDKFFVFVDDDSLNNFEKSGGVFDKEEELRIERNI